MISLSVPTLAGREWEYVKECLDTGWVSSVGAYVDRFEQSIASYNGVRRGVATSSGTAALHIALLVAGVEADDEVLMPSLTFIAPANAVRYVGAWPVFLDSEAAHAQMDINKVESFLRNSTERKGQFLFNCNTGRRVSAILPVHVLGHVIDLEAVLVLGREFQLPIIEDATESLGTVYRGRKTGSWGDISCLSFNGNKVITTGGGGMILTNNSDWADRSKYLTTQAKDDAIESIHKAIGYNYRLTNLQAALGCAQLDQMDGFIASRRRIAARYEAELNRVPGLRLISAGPDTISNCWLSTVVIDEQVYGENSRQVLQRLQKSGIQSRPFWQPIHLSAAHANGAHLPCPVAEQLYSQGLSIPSSPSLTELEQSLVIAELSLKR